MPKYYLYGTKEVYFRIMVEANSLTEAVGIAENIGDYTVIEPYDINGADFIWDGNEETVFVEQ